MKLSFLTLLVLSPIVEAQEYSDYDALLKKYALVDGIRYQACSKSSNDRTALTNILKKWSELGASKLAKNQRAAFRINLYNASIISVVIDEYPINSVTQIGMPFSIFKKNFISNGDRTFSLDTLEKELLLKDYPDARIHFAVNCASVSCPPLLNKSYRGLKLDKQLNEQARKFMSSEYAVQIDNGVASFSPLFKWYKDDFGGAPVIEIVNKYRDESIPHMLQSDWLNYNWDLNESR